MLRSILVGLDGSPTGDSAVELAIRWARRLDAMLAGIAVVDEPTILRPEPVPVGAGPYKLSRDAALMEDARRQVEQLLGRFSARCSEAGVTSRPVRDAGMPSERIVLEAQRHDLIVMGLQPHFHFETQIEADETLREVLKHAPRPLVAVPERLPEGEAVLVAYDGSLQAARALAAFEASGLGRSREVHVLGIADTKDAAARHVDRAVEFLGLHHVAAEPWPVASDRPPALVILESARLVDAGLLVMGAYGQPFLREFFLGSATHTMLETCPLPIFLHH